MTTNTTTNKTNNVIIIPEGVTTLATTKRTRKQTPYKPWDYNEVSNNVFKIGQAIGYKALNSKFKLSANNNLNPNINKPLLEDCQSIATLALLETLDNLKSSYLPLPSLYSVYKSAYSAINKELYRLGTIDFKTLYIEKYNSNDDDNNFLDKIEYANITRDIEHSNIVKRMIKDIKLSQREVRLVKYLAKGYTSETIAKRLYGSNDNASKQRTSKLRFEMTRKIKRYYSKHFNLEYISYNQFVTELNKLVIND